MMKGLEHVGSVVAWRGYGVFKLGDTQNPTERSPEQVAFGDPALSRGDGLDNLQMSFSAAVAL